jgi:IclR family transcriptional regulator, mhp operon transcriptional activator
LISPCGTLDSARRNDILLAALSVGEELMPKSNTIRGLERGLQVLQAFETSPICALQDLHALTRIPKPSLLRILLTLERAGLVARRLADGRYRISANVTRMARQRDRYESVAEAAAPVLERLGQSKACPASFVVPAGDHMELREFSRARNLALVSPDRIGDQIVWLMSGVGRAYLAFCPDKERQDILALLRKSDRPENRLAHDAKRLDRIFADTRQRGYGARDPSNIGGYYGRPPFPDGLAGIAVPLLDRKRVRGCIALRWPKGSCSIEEFAARHLAELKAAADEIVRSLHEGPRRRGKL